MRIPFSLAALMFRRRFSSATARVITPERDDLGMRVDRFLAVASGVTLRDGNARPNHALLQRWARTKLLSLRRPAGSPPVPRRDLLCHKLEAGDAVVLELAALERCTAEADRDARGASESASPGALRGVIGAAPPAWLSQSSLIHVHAAFVVLDKPAGIPVQGGTGIARGASVDCALPEVAALADAAQPVFVRRGGSGSAHGTCSTLRLVHRLDREVGGALLLARTRTAAAILSAAFSDASASGAREDSQSGGGKPAAAPAALLRKTYVAIVAAPLPPGVPPRGEVVAPVVSLDDDDRGGEGSSAQAAATVYSAEKLYLRPSHGCAAASLPPVVTVLHLQPLTGRKHQLRQHVLRLFEGRAAIIGDARYTPLVCGGRPGRSKQEGGSWSAPADACELVVAPDPEEQGGSGGVLSGTASFVSSRPASMALRRRGLSLDSGITAGILPPPRSGGARSAAATVPAASAWLCRHLMLHACKVELTAELVEKLSSAADDTPSAGAKIQRPLVVRSPLPWPMRALLACYVPRGKARGPK